MMNITTALNHLRVARKLGKISNEVQTRTLRRLGYAPVVALSEKAKTIATVGSAEWRAIMDLRAAIEKDIAPQIEAKRKAERDCLDIRYTGDAKRRVAKVAKVAPVVVAPAPVTVDYTCTPEWWEAMEKKERADKKAAKQELKTATADRAQEIIAQWGLVPA